MVGVSHDISFESSFQNFLFDPLCLLSRLHIWGRVSRKRFHWKCLSEIFQMNYYLFFYCFLLKILTCLIAVPSKMGGLLPFMLKDSPFKCYKCPPNFIQLSLFVQKLFRISDIFQTPCMLRQIIYITIYIIFSYISNKYNNNNNIIINHRNRKQCIIINLKKIGYEKRWNRREQENVMDEREHVLREGTIA